MLADLLTEAMNDTRAQAHASVFSSYLDITPVLSDGAGASEAAGNFDCMGSAACNLSAAAFSMLAGGDDGIGNGSAEVVGDASADASPWWSLAVLLVRQLLIQNAFFSGGLLLMLLSSLLYFARNALSTVASFLWSRTHYEITLDSDDEVIAWVEDWLAAHAYSKDARSLEARADYNDMSDDEDAPPSDGRPTVQLVPSAGSHLLRYNGELVYIEKDEKKRVLVGSRSDASTLEKMVLRSRRRETLEALLNEALRKYHTGEEDRMQIYTPNSDYWTRFGSRRARPLSSVILNDDTTERLRHDVQSFLLGAKWYRFRGIPYRRGYLLYGPPGCGKSSFILALAAELNMSVYVLSVARKGMDDETLMTLVNSARQRSILLLEDVDAAFQNGASHRRDEDASQKAAEGAGGTSNAVAAAGPAPGGIAGGITLSGLLNCLDGAVAQEGRVVFMTTNHIEKLDPALIRPGRVDMRVELGLASTSQIERLFVQFYCGIDGEVDPHAEDGKEAPHDAETVARLACAFASRIGNERCSMAQIQGHFLHHRGDPETALSCAEDLLRVAAQASSSDAAVSATSAPVEKETPAAHAGAEKEAPAAQAGAETEVPAAHAGAETEVPAAHAGAETEVPAAHAGAEKEVPAANDREPGPTSGPTEEEAEKGASVNETGSDSTSVSGVPASVPGTDATQGQGE